MAARSRRFASVAMGSAALLTTAAAAPGAPDALAVAAHPVAGHAAAAGSATRWRIVAAPALRHNNALADVVATGPRAAWAVGAQGFNAGSGVPGTPVILRWNGRRWATSYRGSWHGGFSAVAAQSRSSIWALGSSSDGMRLHVLHSSGRGWRSVAFPGKQGVTYANLGLTAASGHAWIITTGETLSSQIFVWNGHSWTERQYPCAGQSCTLYAIKARSASDVWAVGSYLSSASAGSAFALHWNGRSWRSAPIPYTEHAYLTGVFAASAKNAWAVGPIFGTSQMVLYHWSGSAWHAAPVPAGMTAPPLGEATRITGRASGKLWVAGVGYPGAQALYFRYNGTHWASVLGPYVPGQASVTPNGLAAVPGTSATWSVGVALVPGANARARIELAGALP